MPTIPRLARAGESQELAIEVSERIGRVSAIAIRPEGARAGLVLAHGAGAGMRHPFLEAMSRALAERGLATLRYQFPYVEAGKRRPDPPAVLEATVRAAVRRTRELFQDLRLMAGGKSMGGRMTSQAQAREPLQGVEGIVFLGFPLHPPGRSGNERAQHLDAVKVPMLFLQGTRDNFAGIDEIRTVLSRLGSLASLHVVEGANHSFSVPRASGRPEAEVRGNLADAIARFWDAITRT